MSSSSHFPLPAAVFEDSALVFGQLQGYAPVSLKNCFRIAGDPKHGTVGSQLLRNEIQVHTEHQGPSRAVHSQNRFDGGKDVTRARDEALPIASLSARYIMCLRLADLLADGRF
jgi:hypothetical protein